VTGTSPSAGRLRQDLTADGRRFPFDRIRELQRSASRFRTLQSRERQGAILSLYQQDAEKDENRLLTRAAHRRESVFAGVYRAATVREPVPNDFFSSLLGEPQ
jgi:hypothetical protein